MKTSLHCIVALTALFCATSETTASVADCDSALIVSTYNKIEASKSDWRMASHVDSRTYEKLKTDVGVSGVIYGIPVGANFNEFKENIKRYVNDQSASYSQEQFRNVAWTGLGSEAADAYKECIRSQKKGLVLVPDKATDTDISFRVSYNVIGGSANPLPVSWEGGAVGGATLPKAIGAGERIIIIARPSKTSTLAINSADSSGFSDSVVLTPLPEPVPEDKKFSSKCEISQTPNPGPVVAGKSFLWTCPRVRAGTYQVALSVVPSANPGRAVRLGWSASLVVKSDKGEQAFALQTTSGSTIDAGANAGIGTSFESQNNIVDIKEAGALPIVQISINNTYWHGDFSKQSNDPIYIPKSVRISLERK